MEKMWSSRFKEKTRTFRIFDTIRNSERALFSFEIREKLPDVKEDTILTFLSKLYRSGLIKRSDRLAKTPNGGYGQLYGVNELSILKRIQMLEEERNESPEKFTYGTLMKSIIMALKENPTGMTPKEIGDIIGRTSHAVCNCCNKMLKKGLLVRSPFFIPNKINGVSGNMSTIYGMDRQQVLSGLSRLMPVAVKASFIQIMNSDKIWPSWELGKRTKIDNYNLIQWFKKGLCIMGLIKYKTAGNITYYYNSNLPEDIVENQLSKRREDSRQWRLNITALGRMFQKRAVFVYVEYLRNKGYDIKTNPEFPEMVPSWLSQNIRKRYQTTVEDENGYRWTDYSNDVWVFDSDPIDYIIFVRDKNTGAREVHVLTCKRDISKRYGVNYFTTFVGAVKMGRTPKGHDIPGFLTAKPVFICSETYGGKIHTFNNDPKGQAGIILTMEKMKNILDAVGKRYPKEEEFQRMVETKEAYDLYSNHEEVLMGEKTVFQLLKERGIWNDNR